MRWHTQQCLVQLAHPESLQNHQPGSQCAHAVTDDLRKGATLPSARATRRSAHTCSAARRCSMARAPPSTAQE